MTFDKLTIKAQQAVQAAADIAQQNGQQSIEPVHLLAGISEKAPDVVKFLFQKRFDRGRISGAAQLAHTVAEECLSCFFLAGKVVVYGFLVCFHHPT